MKEDERTWEMSCSTVWNSHVTVLSLQPCAGSSDQSPFIIWSTLLCKHTSGPFNLWCQNTHVYPTNYGIEEWNWEVCSSPTHSIRVLCFVLYHDHILCQVDHFKKCRDQSDDQYLWCSALIIHLWSSAVVQYQDSTSSISHSCFFHTVCNCMCLIRVIIVDFTVPLHLQK